MNRPFDFAIALFLVGAAPGLAQSRWIELGPAPITTGPYSGRVAAIAASKSDANRYYVGGADGGVWRSDDAGQNWIPLTDGAPTTAVGAMVIHPTNHDVLWVGTGEANFANHSRYGVGVLKTTDGGHTWSQFGAKTFGGRTFARLCVDAKNPRVLYAAIAHAGGFPVRAAARNHPGARGPLGAFKSTDGGETWAQLTGGLPTTLSATDMAIDPANASTVYVSIGDIFGAAQNGLYKSTDGGRTFQRLGGGLPASGFGRVTVTVAPSRPSRVVAAFVRRSSSTGGGASTLGVYLSDNAGASWRRLSGAGSYHASYGWYLSVAAIAPTDPNAILVGGLSLRVSSNGGSSFSTRTPPHVDLHALEFDAAGRLLCGDDGGIHRSSNLGSRWQALNNNLGMVQFYAGLSLSPTNADLMFGGTQDNGTLARSTGKSWSRRLGGDGGYTSIDSTGQRVFIEWQGTANLYRSTNGGQSFGRVGSGIRGRNCFLPPHEIHPTNSFLMIYGTERVYRSTNGGSNWSPISGDLTRGSGAVQGLAFAPSTPNTIYAATNDGRVQVTEDAGRNWRLSLSGIPTWPRTKRPFAVHPRDARRAWFVVSAFGADQVRATADAGRSWTAVDGDLPDIPANTVAIDLQSGEPPLLYVGTDQGVYRSDDDGFTWREYGEKLPYAPVVDLRVDAKRGRLVASTQGRGIWTIPLSKRR